MTSITSCTCTRKALHRVACSLFTLLICSETDIRLLCSQLQPIQLYWDQIYMSYERRKSPTLLCLITIFTCVKSEAFFACLLQGACLVQGMLMIILAEAANCAQSTVQRSSPTASLL
uniref:Uncharacterized protein n=1 Tax=Rhipicephalus microplus TaxID=6941 RepID=A0A6G5AEU1_RHIMP